MRTVHYASIVLATGMVFAYFGGLTILNPSNFDWFKGGDPLQHLLGWMYFRETPIWQFPLGLNPSFGEAMSSSIVFSDSLPLFAIVLKLFDPILPETFQYFGIWIGLCFLLQALFALEILRRLGVGPWPSVFGAVLVLASPMMLWRLHGHEALIGHWMILAAVYLYLQPRYAARRWLLLVFIATGIHAYLLAMVGGVWLADMIQRRPSWQRILGHSASVLATLGLTAWCLGYFVGPSGETSGFGHYRTTLASWFDNDRMWGRVLPDLPNLEGTYEGFAYLGLGVIMMLAVTSVALIQRRKQDLTAVQLAPEGQSLWPLIVIALVSAAFALSDRVGAFGVVFFDLNLSEGTPLTDIFRSSGRFIWFPTYLLVLFAIAVLARRLPEHATSAVLALAALVQLADISTAAAHFRESFRAPRDSQLQADFWEVAIPRYERLSFWPRRADHMSVVEAGLVAARYGVSIDIARLARHDPVAAAAADTEVSRQLASADWQDDTLYVLQDDRAVDRLRRVGAFGGDDLVVNVDGFVVVAPNWTGDISGLGAEPVSSELPPVPALALPALLRFGSGGNAEPHLGIGWSEGEKPGRWTIGPLATIRIRLAEATSSDKRLTLKAMPFLVNDQKFQDVVISANGRFLKHVKLTRELARDGIQVEIPQDLLAENGEFELQIDIGQPQSPHSAGISSDSRLLGVMVDTIQISE